MSDQLIELLKEQATQIKEYLTNRPKPCVILVGKTGTGKTFCLQYVARQLGFKVWTVDLLVDDVDKLIDRLKLKPLIPTIVHIISAEAVPKPKIVGIINKCKLYNTPIVIETTKPLDIDVCMEVQFYKPKARDVVKLADKLGVTYDKIKTYDDLRQVVLAKYSTMGYEESLSTTKEVEHNLKTGTYTIINDSALSLLLDSAHINFYGKDLYLFIKALQITSKCKRPYPLNGFRVVKPTVISYFLEKLRLIGD